eukprot:6069837-Prymnesium_polylepis.1
MNRFEGPVMASSQVSTLVAVSLLARQSDSRRRDDDRADCSRLTAECRARSRASERPTERRDSSLTILIDFSA